MVEVEEVSDNEEQQQQDYESDDEETSYEHINHGEEEEDDEESSTQQQQQPHSQQPAAGFTSDFQQLLQLASHLKSAQPEVRDKRLKWDRLEWWQKNSCLWQKEDAEWRYSGVIVRMETDESKHEENETELITSSSFTTSFITHRYPHALKCKQAATLLFTQGRYQDSSSLYQRTIGYLQWIRRYQTKDGDEIEWWNLVEKKDKQSQSQQHLLPHSSLNTAREQTLPFPVNFPSLHPEQHILAQQLIYTCLINIAACEEKLGEWQQVVDVCEEALGMDMTEATAAANNVTATQNDESASTSASTSSTDSSSSPSSSQPPPQPQSFAYTPLTIKALFRCATAYNHLDDLEKAIALLTRAVKLSPGDKKIRSQLMLLKKQAKEQQEKDKKSFGGMFERKVDDGDKDEEKEDDNLTTSSTSSSSTSTTPTKPNTIFPSSSTSADQTKQFMKDYMAGFKEQAQMSKKNEKEKDTKSSEINTMKSHTRTKKTKNGSGSDDDDDENSRSSSSSSSSFLPSSFLPSTISSSSSPDSLAAVYADAKQNFGIDLSDPLVQEELKRLQEEHRRTGMTIGEREEEEKRMKKKQGSTSSAVKGTSNRSTTPTTVPSDLKESNDWMGPIVFCLIIAFALKWMGLI